MGDNTRAALITRGLAELARLAMARGGSALTLAGLAGLGDLVLTCTGEASRNRTVGYEMGRGRKLADTGDNGRTLPCVGCHGADLRSGPELEGPPLAGRFASYLFRQLYGFKSGARGGNAAQPMQSVVANLTQADMIDLAAYAASLKP